jgi:hypothetical protein
MLRTVLTLLMAGMQGMIAAPLYVCTSARGAVGLDGGQALCGVRHCCPAEQHSGCSHQNDSTPPVLPCNCRHEPLGGEVQQVRRAETIPSGDLLVTALVAEQCRVSTQPGERVSWTPAVDRDSLARTELASVYLRC